VSQVILQHHERYDGQGYPNGIAGSDISLLAQILSVADIYVALVEKRVYKKSLTNEEALAFIDSESEGAFSETMCQVVRRALMGVEIPTDLAELEAC